MVKEQAAALTQLFHQQVTEVRINRAAKSKRVYGGEVNKSKTTVRLKDEKAEQWEGLKRQTEGGGKNRLAMQSVGDFIVVYMYLSVRVR